MPLKTRVLIIILASLTGLVAMGAFGLYTMRKGMMDERQAQLSQLLDFAQSQLAYFHSLETSGKLSREVAQERAKEAIAAQRQGDNYFFIRTLTDDVFVYHPVASRIGKADPGDKMPDGRTIVQTYRDELAKNQSNKAFVFVKVARPNNPDKTLQPKMNGVVKFEPWGWMPGTGFYTDDIEKRFWQQAGIFLAVGSILFALLAGLVFQMRAVILRQLGGEPQEAMDSMRKIANGDLNVQIALENDDNSSMMASLKMMQMKLVNLTASIQENASSLSAQVDGFDTLTKAYADTRSEEDFAALQRAVKKMGKSADVLGKSVSRFRL
jgi:methyl-accepting chemotaxis protein